MARFEITAPDGARYEVNAPEGATEQQAIQYLQTQMGAQQPKQATPSAAEPSIAADVGDQLVRGINRGMNAVVALPGEIVGGAINAFAPGQGDRFKWNNAASEFMTSPQAKPQTDAGRYADSVGQAIGASVAPVGGMLAKARQAAPAAQTAMGQVGQGLIAPYRAAPGAAVATDAAAAVGAGVGQQIAQDLDTGPVGEFAGGFIGAMTPLALASAGTRVVDAARRSPTLARFRSSAQPDEAMPQSAGAARNPMLEAGEPTPPVIGADSAANQHIANRLSAAGVKPGEIGSRLARSDADAIGGPSPLALVDLDNSLQRLAGSVTRQNQEAGNIGQRFVAGRQTGITPLDGMPDAGIPTRQLMEPRQAIDPPAGMYERMSENVRSALNVPPKSAYRVDQDLVATQKSQSSKNYGEAYSAAKGMDIAPVVDSVLLRWEKMATDPKQLRPVAAKLQKAINFFRTKAGTVSDLERFQTAKELLDEEIGNLTKSLVGRNRRLGGELNTLKNELLAAVDKIPKVGDSYQKARNVFSSTAEMREALELGQKALREGSEASADKYRALTAGEQQNFRIGLADAIDRTIAAQKRGADVTQVFQNPRMQQLLMEVMSADDAMRLGRNIQTENLTTRTANEVFGNSKTAQRLADDEAFNQMGDAIEAIRSVRSPTDAGFKAVKAILERVGGFRADTATSLANKLFTADRAQLDEIIKQIEARMGPTRAEHFRSMLQRYRMSAARQTSTAVATTQPQQQPPAPPPNPYPSGAHPPSPRGPNPWPDQPR